MSDDKKLPSVVPEAKDMLVPGSSEPDEDSNQNLNDLESDLPQQKSSIMSKSSKTSKLSGSKNVTFSKTTVIGKSATSLSKSVTFNDEIVVIVDNLEGNIEDLEGDKCSPNESEPLVKRTGIKRVIF